MLLQAQECLGWGWYGEPEAVHLLWHSSPEVLGETESGRQLGLGRHHLVQESLDQSKHTHGFSTALSGDRESDIIGEAQIATVPKEDVCSHKQKSGRKS